MDNNQKLEALLGKRNLTEGYIIRYVYVLENERNELFFIHRVDQVGRVSGDFYLGWQLSSTCYWGIDLWDIDILEIAADSITQMINIPTKPKDIQLIDCFNCAKEDFLHLVYYVKYDDTSQFRHWTDWDDDEKWIPKDKALAFAPFQSDKRIIQLLQSGNQINLL